MCLSLATGRGLLYRNICSFWLALRSNRNCLSGEERGRSGIVRPIAAGRGLRNFFETTEGRRSRASQRFRLVSMSYARKLVTG